MSLTCQILGNPFEDNALFVRIEPGERIHRILFDCGEKCLDPLRPATIQAIDHLCFSHYHLDHVGGFDRFLRFNYNREQQPVRLWGPRNSREVLHHRLQGVTWDLLGDQPGEWIVSEVTDTDITVSQFFPREAFAHSHSGEKLQSKGVLFTHQDYQVEARIMDHRVPTLAYRISEPQQYNIDGDALAKSQLHPGPWLEKVRDQSMSEGHQIQIGEATYSLGELREELLITHSGESVAYATDLLYNSSRIQSLVEMISGCDLFVCESTYASEDASLAAEHYHLTASQAAQIAANAKVSKLILIHISKRYMQQGKQKLLAEARKVFPETYFPVEWASKM